MTYKVGVGVGYDLGQKGSISVNMSIGRNYNYLCNQYLKPLKLWVLIPLRRGVLDTTLCDKICQWLAAGWWFSMGTPVSSTNKTDRHDITEILLKVVLNTQWVENVHRGYVLYSYTSNNNTVL
jgi:hypothetical protein